MDLDPMVLAHLNRAAKIAQRRGATDVSFADFFESLCGQPLAQSLAIRLAAACALAEERSDGVVMDEHVLLTQLDGHSALLRALEWARVENIEDIRFALEESLATIDVLGAAAGLEAPE